MNFFFPPLWCSYFLIAYLEENQRLWSAILVDRNIFGCYCNLAIFLLMHVLYFFTIGGKEKIFQCSPQAISDCIWELGTNQWWSAVWGSFSNCPICRGSVTSWGHRCWLFCRTSSWIGSGFNWRGYPIDCLSVRK